MAAHLLPVIEAFFGGETPKVRPFDRPGNINLDAFHVEFHGREFLLQRLNTDVFRFPERVFQNALAWMRSQRESDAEWQTMEFAPTVDGQPFFRSPAGDYWRLIPLLPSVVTYSSLVDVGQRSAQLEIAAQVGVGLAKATRYARSLHAGAIQPSLPGYRNTAGYLAQFRAVWTQAPERFLPTDPELRESTGASYFVHRPEGYANRRARLEPFAEITDLIEEEVVAFWAKFPAGGVIHGDTKLENFLFHQDTGRVRSLIDLDTVMAGHWLMDWADLIRSLVNVAGEKAESLDAVKIDAEVFTAAQAGFLVELPGVSDAEVEAMSLAPRYLAFEQALRFLTDYLRGDNYYRLSATDPPELNMHKGLVQLRLFEEFARVTSNAE
jgi:hypothetical protein